MAGWIHGNLDPDLQLAIDAAQRDFGAFFEFVGRGSSGESIQMRPLDDFMWRFVEAGWAAGAPIGLMVPTGFGKTTASAMRVAYELGRDPNLLCAFVTDSEENSTARVDMVRKIVQSRAYRLAFPKVRLVRGKDSASGFTVERSGFSKDATVSGHGILTGTGARTSLLVLDDVVTFRNAVLEPANRERVYQAIRTTWLSRGQRSEGRPPRVLWIQTAYHAQDASARVREDRRAGWWWLVVRAEPPFRALRFEIWKSGAIVSVGELPCPYPASYLQSEWDRQGPAAAAQSLANRPVDPESCPFRPEMLQAPPPLPPGEYECRTVYADPAGDASTARGRDTDWCACVAVGKHRERGWEVYGCERRRGSPSQQMEFIAGFVVRMKAESIFQEAVKDEALVTMVQGRLRELGCSLAVEPDKPATNKERRIVQVLEPALTRGLLRISGDAFPELLAEMVAFPAAPHDDLVDAVASCFLKAAGSEAAAQGDRLISHALLETAADCVPPAGTGVHLGVAAACFEDEESVAVLLRDGVVRSVARWPGLDVGRLVARVNELRVAAGTGAAPLPAEHVHIEGVGIGAAAVERFRRDDVGVERVDLFGRAIGDWSESIPAIPFRDRRAELFWVCRHLLASGGLSIPRGYVDLWGDTTSPLYGFDAQGRLHVEAREEAKKRMNRSPVAADALVLALSRASVGSMVL